MVFGHSGTNSSGIDTALYCKKRGVKVIAINSSFNRNKKSKHSSGKLLADTADVAIDTRSPVEDAIVPIEGVTLHDTDEIYGQYKERLIEAQSKHLPFFKERMSGKA